MLAAQRRELILDAVRSGHTAEVVELAQRFSVSEMTVRRDLARLAHEGRLRRVHGGAVSEREEPPFAQIAVERLAEKERIGGAAAALVADDQTVMIDIGTTTLQLARHLHGRRLTVITSSLAVIEELLPDAGIDLVVLGGSVRRNYRSLVGVLAEDALRQLSADVAFIGASGDGRRSVRDGHDDGRGADQARDDRRGPAQGAARRHGEVRDVRLGQGLQARPRWTRSSPTPPGRSRSPSRSPRPASSWCTREDRDPRRRRLPGADGVRRAPRAGGAARARGGRALRRRRVPPRPDRAGARRARARARRRSWSSARRCASRRRSTARTSSSARSGSASSRAAWSTSRCRSPRASSGRRRPVPAGICFALRTVPVMVELAAGGRRAGAAGVVRQLHEPGRPRHRGDPGGARDRAVGICDSPAGLCRRVAAALDRGPTTSGSTTSA